MKKITSVITNIIVFTILFCLIKSQNVYSGTGDAAPPILNSLSLNKSYVEQGGTITVTANVTDDVSGVAEVVAYFKQEGQFNYIHEVTLVYTGVDNTYSGDLTTFQHDKGTYVVDNVLVKDNAGHAIRYPYSRDANGRVISFTIINDVIYDTTPPIIESIRFDKNLVSPGEDASIIIRASDNASPIHSIKVMLKRTPGGASRYFYLSETEEAGVFSANIPISIYEFGTYSPSWIDIMDEAGNHNDYDSSKNSMLRAAVLTISGGTEDTSSPLLLDVSLDKTSVCTGDAINVSATVSDDISGVKDITIYFEGDSSGLYPEVSLTPTGNGDEYSGTLFISDYEWGNYHLYKCSLVDNAGNDSSERFDGISFYVDNEPPAPTKLNTPTNLHWSGEANSVAEWDPVPNASGYSIHIQVDGANTSKYSIKQSSTNSYDCKSELDSLFKLVSDISTVKFKVQAVSNNTSQYVNGDFSAFSEDSGYRPPLAPQRLATPTNLCWSGDINTIASWDAVPSATRYVVYTYVFFNDGNKYSVKSETNATSVDLKEKIDLLCESSDEDVKYVKFKVLALGNNVDTLDSLESDYSADSSYRPENRIPSLSTPNNLRWSGNNNTVASWNAVPNAKKYRVSVYIRFNNSNKDWSADTVTATTSIDLKNTIDSLYSDSGYYDIKSVRFKVSALGDNLSGYRDSLESDFSDDSAYRPAPIIPTMISASLSPTTIEAGDNLAITIKMTNNVPNLNEIYVKLHDLDNSGQYIAANIPKTGTDNEGNAIFSITVKTSNSLEPDTYYIYGVVVEDTRGRSILYTSLQPTRREERALPESIKNTTIEVTSRQEPVTDTTPPVLTSVTVSPSSITIPGSTTVTVKANDDISGVKKMEAAFSCASSQQSLLADLSYSGSDSDGTDIFIGSVSIDEYIISGDYYLSSIILCDNADNTVTYLKNIGSASPSETTKPLPTWASSIKISVENVEITQLPTPQNVNWSVKDITMASWDPVEHAKDYTVQIDVVIPGSRTSTYVLSNNTSIDLKSSIDKMIESLNNSYSIVAVRFRVQANSENTNRYASSDWSDFSNDSGFRGHGKETVQEINENTIAVKSFIILDMPSFTVSKWKSSNNRIASVNSKGKVTAKTPGTVIITAIGKGENPESVDYVLHVEKPYLKNETLRVNDSFSILSMITGTERLMPKSITSSNTEVLTVDNDGNVTIHKSGKSKITVYYAHGTISATFTVKLPKIKETEYSIQSGKYKKLTITNMHKDVAITFGSSNKAVATVSDKGNVYAVGPGAAIISLYVNGEEYDTCTFIVQAPGIKQSSITLKPRKTKALSFINKGANSTVKSSNEKIATVSQNGKVKAIAPGTAIITISVNGMVYDTCEVIVE